MLRGTVPSYLVPDGSDEESRNSAPEEDGQQPAIPCGNVPVVVRRDSSDYCQDQDDRRRNDADH